jgi:Family of unknown function (DUF6210)
VIGRIEHSEMSDPLTALRHKWTTTGSFQDEQAYLAASVRAGAVQFVFLDPDGTTPEWLAVVVRRQTGVVYSNQCGGVATIERLIEGYLVPVGGSQYDVDDRNTEPRLFLEIFHEGDACKYDWTGRTMPRDRLARLRRLVAGIPYWTGGFDGVGQKHRLRLDELHVEDISEAWIPVETPDGPGVLLCKNCD